MQVLDSAKHGFDPLVIPIRRLAALPERWALTPLARDKDFPNVA